MVIKGKERKGTKEIVVKAPEKANKWTLHYVVSAFLKAVTNIVVIR